MRVPRLVICAVCFLVGAALPLPALARPKTRIAVAPLDGDPGNKVAEAVVEALSGKDYAVVGPRETGREIARLGLSDELDAKATRKLAGKLGVVAIIGGKVSKAGKKRSVHLEVHRRGKPDNGFTVEFKSASSTGFRRGIHAEIGKKLDGADADPADDDDARPRTLAEADDGARRRKADDDDRQRKADDDDRRRKADDDDRRRKADDDAAARKRKLADDDTAARRRKADDGRRPRRVAASDDDDGAAVRKRRSRARAGDAAPLPTARVAAGASVAQRQLSWDTRSGFTQVPPRVLTTAGAGRVDGELYPFALGDPGSSLAGLGVAAAYDRTVGLSIKVPNQTVSAPINQSHYAVGVRYRFGIGDASSLALGLDYARRRYVAERGGLMGATLDAPDVDYSAISPGVALRVPVTGSVTVFGSGDGLLIFEAGAIQKSASYGPATVYGVEGSAGVEIALTRQIGLRIALEYSQILFHFTPSGTTLANNRDADPTTQDVMGATDRSIGGAVTLGLSY